MRYVFWSWHKWTEAVIDLVARVEALEAAGGGEGDGTTLERKVIAGGAAGAHAVAGILAADTIVSVIAYLGAGIVVTDVLDLTSEFTVTGDNAIDNTSGTNTAGGKLVVEWRTAA